MQVRINDVVISVNTGDITAWAGDFIVNASNSGLYGGGGVDGAIHRAGGPQISAECAVIRQKQGGVMPGQAALTTAGRLPNLGIIHTVGPIWKGGGAGEAATLAKCYISSLELACARGARSIAYPNISTGVYGFPRRLACETALAAVVDYVQSTDPGKLPLNLIAFVCFEQDNTQLYEEMLRTYVTV